MASFEMHESVPSSEDADSYVYAPAPPAAPAPAAAIHPSAIAGLTSEWDLENSAVQEAEAAAAAQAAARDEELDSSDPSPLKVLGARGFYLAPSRPWLDRLNHFFPERDSRIFFCIAILLALVISGVWLQQTISNKWIHDIQHPATTLSIDTLLSVPAVHGMVTMFHQNLWLNQSLANTFRAPASPASGASYALNPLTPLPSYTIPGPVLSEYIGSGYNWHEVFLRSKKVSADPAHLDRSLQTYTCTSNPMLLPAPFPTDVCLPRGFDAILDSETEAAWPLTFHATTDLVCIRSYKLLDPRVSIEIEQRMGDLSGSNDSTSNPDSVPYQVSFGGSHARFGGGSPALFVTLADVDAIRREVRDEPGVPDPLTLSQLWANLIPLEFGRRHTIRTRLSRTINVNNQASWHTDLDYGGSLAFSPGVAQAAFAAYFAAAPEFFAQLNRDPNLVLDDAAPNATGKFYMETCFSPSSFQISTVTETRSYNGFTFLSDIGGFLNIIAIAFAIAFPFAQVLIKPRRFLGTWAWSKVVGSSSSKTKTKTKAAAAAAAAAATLAAAPTSKVHAQGPSAADVDDEDASLGGPTSISPYSPPLARPAPRVQYDEHSPAAASGNINPLEAAKQPLLDDDEERKY